MDKESFSSVGPGIDGRTKETMFQKDDDKDQRNLFDKIKEALEKMPDGHHPDISNDDSPPQLTDRREVDDFGAVRYIPRKMGKGSRRVRGQGFFNEDFYYYLRLSCIATSVVLTGYTLYKILGE